MNEFIFKIHFLCTLQHTFRSSSVNIIIINNDNNNRKLNSLNRKLLLIIKKLSLFHIMFIHCTDICHQFSDYYRFTSDYDRCLFTHRHFVKLFQCFYIIYDGTAQNFIECHQPHHLHPHEI